MAGVAKQHLGARGGAAVRVGRRVRRVIVRPHVGFDLHDASRQETGGSAMNQKLAQQTRSDQVGAVFEEGAREKFAGEGRRTGQCSLRIDGVLAVNQSWRN
jgi:hypothetical protein